MKYLFIFSKGVEKIILWRGDSEHEMRKYLYSRKFFFFLGGGGVGWGSRYRSNGVMKLKQLHVP